VKEKTFTRRILLVVLASALSLTLPGASPDSVRAQADTYTVNSNADTPDVNPGDGLCATTGGTCTLHAAIQEANLDGGSSLIKFASPMDISYPSLPTLTEGVTTIDASDLWDGTWPLGRPGVKIIGGSPSNPLLTIQADGCVVRGIEFVSGSGVGVHVGGSGSFNTIGGAGTGQRNVFLAGTGVQIQSTGFGNTVAGNYLGTWDGESPVPSDIGIYVRSDGNTIESNLIGGHTDAGIFIWSGDNNFVQNDNIIGANKSKNAAMPNAVGIKIVEANYNLIWRNFVAGNTSYGIELRRADYSSIINNQIGYGFFSLGNGSDGIHAFDSHNNQFGGELASNQIAKNGGYGVWVNGDDNDIQGSTIFDNVKDGVYIDYGQDNQIGGAGLLGNEITGNGTSGVRLTGTGTISNTVSGNYIGLDTGALDGGNLGYGVLIEGGAHSNWIGGLDSGEGNWIGYNDWSGIYITGSSTQNNVVEGNVIGAPINWGWPAPNGHHGIGIYDGAHNNWIGIGNTIVGSLWSGVAIVESDDNVVWFNYVGTNGAGVNWGNSYYGIVIANSAGNAIFGNEIANNGTDAGQAGIRVDGGLAGNPINVNSIHDNAGAGIELVNGGNFELGAPTNTQASCQGPVAGASCSGCTIEIFSDAAEEGRIYEGTTTADGATGAFSWSGTPSGPNVTATATTSAGATSPFSAPFNTGTCNAQPTAAFNVNPTTGITNTVFSFDASSSSDPEDPTSALEVRWDWDDNGTYDTIWSTTKIATHTFTTFGLFSIRLQVRDTVGLTDATTQQVEVTTTPQVFLPLISK
jgi:CSLREA domain-containing protein